jgi:hypothetical protein
MYQPYDIQNTIIERTKQQPTECWPPAQLNATTCSNPDFFNSTLEATLAYNISIGSINVQEFTSTTAEDLVRKYIIELPKGDCKQVVLGVLQDLVPYFYYNAKVQNPPFHILMSNNWTATLNNEYVTCAMIKRIIGQNNCSDYALRILLPKSGSNLYRTDNTGKITPRVTVLELCIVSKLVRENNIDDIKQLVQPNVTDNFSYDIILLKLREKVTNYGGRRGRRNTQKSKRTYKKKRTNRKKYIKKI